MWVCCLIKEEMKMEEIIEAVKFFKGEKQAQNILKATLDFSGYKKVEYITFYGCKNGFYTDPYEWICTKEEYNAMVDEMSNNFGQSIRKNTWDAVKELKGEWEGRYICSDDFHLFTHDDGGLVSFCVDGKIEGYTYCCTREQFDTLVEEMSSNFGCSLTPEQYREQQLEQADTSKTYKPKAGEKCLIKTPLTF